jgi:hypothetical protein
MSDALTAQRRPVSTHNHETDLSCERPPALRELERQLLPRAAAKFALVGRRRGREPFHYYSPIMGRQSTLLRRCQWLPRAFDFWPLSRAQRILHEGVAEYSRMAVCVWVCGCGCGCVGVWVCVCVCVCV